mgnify:CR=1 FL=1
MRELIIKAINEYSMDLDSQTAMELADFALEVIDKNKKINLRKMEDFDAIKGCIYLRC